MSKRAKDTVGHPAEVSADPLLIVTLSRSGSSLLTTIVARHGFGLGRCVGVNRFRYESHENARIKALIKDKWKNPSKVPALPRKDVNFREIVLSEAPHGLPFLIKTFVPLSAVWLDAFQNSPRIYSLRNTEQMARSIAAKHGRRDLNVIVEELKPRVSALLCEASSRGLPVVNMTDVVAGDFSVLRDALALVGVELDDEIARSSIVGDLAKGFSQ